MRLHSLTTTGYRRSDSATILFGDATFLIGPNNAGKSSSLKAIEALLGASKRLDTSEYYSIRDEETGETKISTKVVTITAEFRNLPNEAKTWRGFKGRIGEYTPSSDKDSGLGITYRKTYSLGEDVIIEIKTKKRHLKAGFETIKKPRDLITAGISEGLVSEIFPDLDLDKTIPVGQRARLEEIDEMWDLEEGDDWFKNPGGIPGNILSRLPRFLIIPADGSDFELSDDKGGVLCKTLTELFEDVRGVSENYKSAQSYLGLLAKELDPADKTSKFGAMLDELNGILSGVFPGAQLHVAADLSSPDSLKPKFQIELASNIKTKAQKQGTGMVRSAVFGILRYRQRWLSKREDTGARSLIIGFEEPELYLHPSAANQMRDTIYDISTSDCQIVATTHSPYVIDLSRKPKQVLNRFSFAAGKIEIAAFSVTEAFQEMQADDKQYIKMLLRLDGHAARMFFTQNIAIVEGDTEDVLIQESIRRLPRKERLLLVSSWEIIKARGKAAIIPLVAYLKAVGIHPMVMHDKDGGVAGAEVFNEPIRNAAGTDRVICLENCVEDVLGYPPPSREKPFKAFEVASAWGKDWDDIPALWREKLVLLFGGMLQLSYPKNIAAEPVVTPPDTN